MCLIAFAVDAHPDFKLILAANRDEFYKRPTSPAHFWEDHAELLGGRDEEAGGTWMAISKSGRFSAVTNYRDLTNLQDDAISRGELPVNFLLQSVSPEQYLKQVDEISDAYNGFNLLCWAEGKMCHYSNYEKKINRISPGIYGLSNALLDTSWPKVTKLKDGFSAMIKETVAHEDLLTLLQDDAMAADDQLPDTGVGKELEKMLSAICIKSENYGTCCSTIVTISNEGKVKFTEWTYPVGKRTEGKVSFEFQI